MSETGKEMQPPLPSDLHGDLLESIMTKVATVDLLPASHVSRSWWHAVSSSLRHSPRVKPWLLLCLRHVSVGYDPHNRTWVPLPLPLSHPTRSSHPQLLYSLIPPSNLSVAQPASATWTNLPLPKISRVDPIIALVGSRVVVAGGTWDFEDAGPGAVESFDLAGEKRWQPSDPIPAEMRNSATHLSVATSDSAMHVLDKSSGTLASFDAETGRWSRTCELVPGPTAIGFSSGRLILAALSYAPLSLTLWELKDLKCAAEIGRMPREMVERLVGEGLGSLVTIGFSVAGDCAYVYNPDCFEMTEWAREEKVKRPSRAEGVVAARAERPTWNVSEFSGSRRRRSCGRRVEAEELFLGFGVI